jgi:BON domain
MSQISFAPVRNAATSARSAATSVRSAPAPIRSAAISVRSATAPVRSVTHTAMRAGRRGRRRRRTRRAAIGSWWKELKVALGLGPAHRRVTDAPVPQIAAAVGAGAVAVVAVRHRRSRRATYLEGRVNGVVPEIPPTETATEDDRALADKVRAEIFGRPDAPKESVKVWAVDGIVYLRGEVTSSDEIQRLIDDTLAVAGVLRVESMLHTAGTPAPSEGAA